MSTSVSTAAAGFGSFRLHESLERGIRAAGFESPRPIQLGTIPAGLEGRDVLGLAQTGTGKTAAFALPLLHRLLATRVRGPRALVLAPTRELATQIAHEMRDLSKFTPLRMVTIFGGVSMHGQIRALRETPDIVVGCPGRVLDLAEQGVLRLDRIETLVLDEADHMFDMGFLPFIRRILERLPARRQNLLFSATMPREIRRLADDILRNPHVVEMASSAPASTIDHSLMWVAEERKHALLERVLADDGCTSAIVFTRTKHRARRLAEQLCKQGHRAVGLQGNMSQPQRDRAMRGFRSRQFDVLVATDIAARGLDISAVSHVINFDVPSTPEAYTHRIGRTGRAEREGVACTFVTSGDRGWVRATERMIGAPIPQRRIEGFDPGAPAPAVRPIPAGVSRSAGGRPGGRDRASTSRPAGSSAAATASPGRGRGGRPGRARGAEGPRGRETAR